ncbi:hypothetical protein [Paenibacillus brevis]|uniref:Uncharacterized protein n=1 Tax=Paenibacillus brevis TaxID=2841508 RepID=A0ABS6FJQ6_9BACL|nr:hypothetical protein [Paenibacillus brevis]MBU5670234.1 hypothetical protein [Paenibacillus brevis]
MKKTIAKLLTIPLFVVSLMSSSTSAFAVPEKTSSYDPMTESSTVTFDYIREKALKEGLAIDINKYEAELGKTLALKSTQSNQQNLSFLLDDYIVYSETEYPDSHSQIGISAVSGDTRIITEYAYGAQTEYKNTRGDLAVLANKVFEFGAGLTHPYVGAFMSILGFFINESEYESYNSTITRSLHDYVIINKKVEVYRNNIWEPMATSQKKNTHAQLNTVYYKGNVRYTPSNLDIGQISGQAGNFFYDEDRLRSLAKNTLYPLFYSYSGGTVVNVTPYFPF